jgi:hypothetical protein
MAAGALRYVAWERTGDKPPPYVRLVRSVESCDHPLAHARGKAGGAGAAAPATLRRRANGGQAPSLLTSGTHIAGWGLRDDQEADYEDETEFEGDPAALPEAEHRLARA